MPAGRGVELDDERTDLVDERSFEAHELDVLAAAGGGALAPTLDPAELLDEPAERLVLTHGRDSVWWSGVWGRVEHPSSTQSWCDQTSRCLPRSPILSRRGPPWGTGSGAHAPRENTIARPVRLGRSRQSVGGEGGLGDADRQRGKGPGPLPARATVDCTRAAAAARMITAIRRTVGLGTCMSDAPFGRGARARTGQRGIISKTVGPARA